jgi:hypothetical protein
VSCSFLLRQIGRGIGERRKGNGKCRWKKGISKNGRGEKLRGKGERKGVGEGEATGEGEGVEKYVMESGKQP